MRKEREGERKDEDMSGKRGKEDETRKRERKE